MANNDIGTQYPKYRHHNMPCNSIEHCNAVFIMKSAAAHGGPCTSLQRCVHHARKALFGSKRPIDCECN